MGETVIRERNLIAVEGKDEKNFTEALLIHLNVKSVQVIDIGGKDNFKNRIPALTLTRGFDRVVKFGIVRDADNDSSAALKSIQSALAKAKLSQPKKVSEFAGGSPLVGIFIMPDYEEKGMLEDLCLKSIQGSTELNCIEDFFKCIKSDEIRNLSKAKVQAYLSTKPKSVNSLGVGAQNGYWNLDHPCFSHFSDFLRSFA